MENSDARPVRRVRCPRCHSVLEEPGAPVYQCGGCGTTLRAKNRTGNTGDAASRGSPSTSGLPPQTTHLDSTHVASTSRSSTPPSLAATSGTHHVSDATGRHASGDLVSARRRNVSGDVASTSSTPTATSSRRQGTRSQGESGDLVSEKRNVSGDVASTSSSTPDATSSRRQGIDKSGDLVSERGHVSGDVASTSSTPDATTRRRQGTDTTSRRESSGDLVSARNRVSEQVALIEKRGNDQTAAANQEVFVGNPEGRRPRDAGVSVHFASRNEDAELQDDTEKRMKRQAESTDAARKKHSGEAAVQPQYHHDLQEQLAPKSAPAPASAAQSARDVSEGKEDDAVVAGDAGGKALSPSRHQELEAENLGPLRQRILKTVDELKGDLSELFSKSPDLNPTPRPRRPRLPKQEEERYASHAAVASRLPAARARHGDGHRGSALIKPRQVTAAHPPPRRGLPSRRYRQCRADPWCHSVSSCHHGCCRHHGKPECSSCRGHCCRPRTTHEPPSSVPRPRNKLPPAASKEATKRRPAPRNHCRPVLKGAPFIICSGCFKLVQVPADFAVATKTVRKLRCGACSTVLSYSYRDPARKTKDNSLDQLSMEGSEIRTEPDPFAPFVDGFGLSSYSTEDEQPLHVSRNSSLGSIGGVGRLHRLMGYGSASELLRHSPDLYESFSERTTPDVGRYDRKGKGVCVEDDHDVYDSDEEDSGVLKRSAARGSAGWPLPAPGAIRIK